MLVNSFCYWPLGSFVILILIQYTCTTSCLETNLLFSLPQRHMRNEKLVPMTLPDPRERIPYLPQPNGDNKLTAAMVPYYTGNTNTVSFLYTLKTSLIPKNLFCYSHAFVCVLYCSSFVLASRYFKRHLQLTVASSTLVWFGHYELARKKKLSTTWSLPSVSFELVSGPKTDITMIFITQKVSALSHFRIF